MNALLDKDFLKRLDESHQRITYVRVTSLDFNEQPASSIEGQVTQGSLTVDGKSSLRRTCSLTLVSTPQHINQIDWTLRTKFMLHIGLQNTIDPRYDDIIWFKQGVFVLTSFNSQINGQGVTITLQGKDKMCLLDGSVGGQLFAAHDFSGIWTLEENGISKKELYSIKNIIQEAVHTYAGTDYANILINDLDGWSVELLTYKINNRSAIIHQKLVQNNWITQITFDTSDLGVALLSALGYIYKNGKWVDAPEISDDQKSRRPDAEVAGKPFNIDKYDKVGGEYAYPNGCRKVIKIVDYNETIGYRPTELTYPGELTISAGGSITQMLDKIVELLGEYEYFYNVDGQFIFQRKRTYYNVSWNSQVNNEGERYYLNAMETQRSVYDFTNSFLVESVQLKPNITNIKNDYSIWGKRGTTKDGTSIHMRIAIDDKPNFYYSPKQSKFYFTTDAGALDVGTNLTTVCDWREIIYQMAIDNQSCHGDLEAKRLLQEGYTEKKDGDEVIYVQDKQAKKAIHSYVKQLNPTAGNSITEDEAWKSYLATWNKGYDAYYADMLAFWRDIYDPTKGDWEGNGGWNPDVILYTEGEPKLIFPEGLTFWIDFLDTKSDLAAYSVSEIGRRTLVVTDNDTKAMGYQAVPELLFMNTNKDSIHASDLNISYERMNVPDSFYDFFQISTQGKSISDVMNTQLYQHTYYQDTISMSVLPIYYLEPNTRIHVEDQKLGINHDYVITQLSYRLGSAGMMTLQGSIAEQILL